MLITVAFWRDCGAISVAQNYFFVSLDILKIFHLIFHKSYQDAQERFCGLPCWSWGCERIKYKPKLLFFPFHTRAIRSTEGEADTSPRAPWRAGKYWYSNYSLIRRSRQSDVFQLCLFCSQLPQTPSVHVFHALSLISALIAQLQRVGSGENFPKAAKWSQAGGDSV